MGRVLALLLAAAAIAPAVGALLPVPTGAPAIARAATGPQDVLVLMIDFTDVQGAPGSSAQIGALMNGPTDSAADFYAETSWGQLALQGTVFPASGWRS